MNTKCPACGYELGFSPWNGASPSDEICPCCGIQFGYSDAAGGDPKGRILVYERWRAAWINNGMLWDEGKSSPPAGWDPHEQLRGLIKQV
jgi:hypothetical protein